MGAGNSAEQEPSHAAAETKSELTAVPEATSVGVVVSVSDDPHAPRADAPPEPEKPPM